MVPIVKMRYIDWKYYEDLNNSVFNSVIEKCKEVGLYDIMGFRYNWNKEILSQFHCSYYYNPYDNTITWTTQGNKCTIDYMTFSRLFGLRSKDEDRTPIHNENKYKPRELTFMFPSHKLAIEGKADQLNPYYYYLNQFFRATIDPKQGDAMALRYYAPNLLNRMAPDEEGFCIFDFIWNELRRAMNDPMKYLPYAPYLMYMIERVTNVRYPKDVVHEPFRHLRDRAKKAPKARKYVGSSSAAPRHDDLPAAPCPPRTPCRHRGSLIQRVLKSIFSCARQWPPRQMRTIGTSLRSSLILAFLLIPTVSSPLLMIHLRNVTLKMKKDKRKKRRRTMKKKRRRMMATPSDPAAPHFLFGV
jgi:hypothetical protein